ncbi:MAG: META domain-containing protein [Ferruginibacter sp.]
MKKVIYLAAAAVFGLSACHCSKKAASAQTATLKDTYWKLIELNGGPVTGAPDSKEAYVILHTKDNRASGNGGCNGFGGTYELNPNGFNIRFSAFIRTQMACPGLDIENRFLGVFEKADSYYVINDTLQLNRARMAPLAKFVAVKGKAETIQ